jgi:hypothetical protein
MPSLILVASLLTIAQTPPDDWSCDGTLFADGTCDCGCGALDVDDCGQSTEFDNCVRSGCPQGQAPWEHENFSCMASACGDGWKDDEETCDDFDALAGGGCNADCSAVTAGFTCGIGAEGCSAEGEGEGEGEGEDEGEGEGEGAEGEGEGESGGCTAAPGSVFGLVSIALLMRRRRR